jgi:putative DNA primase/helicase
LDGVGFVLTADDPYVAIDLDHCRDPDSGAIGSWAQAVVDHFSTYTEVSPSGTGLRIFLKGQLPAKGCKRGNIEVYDQKRYVTLTGCHLLDTPKTIEGRQGELDAWHREVFGEPHTRASSRAEASANGHGSPYPLADDAVTKKARAAANSEKFARLWAGNYESDHPSHSEADGALCCMLAFWTPDAAQIDRLFRQSALMRDKWDQLHGEDTYGAMTIKRALALVTDSYSGNGHQPAATTGTTPPGSSLPWIDATNTRAC